MPARTRADFRLRNLCHPPILWPFKPRRSLLVFAIFSSCGSTFESRLTDELIQQLTEVVHGYVGPCDPVAARAGMEWMRDRYRARGEVPRF